MHSLLLFAQEVTDPSGTSGTGFLTWILLGAGTFVLWLMIRNTRKKANRHFMERQEREDEERRNDPDLAKPPEQGGRDDGPALNGDG